MKLERMKRKWPSSLLLHRQVRCRASVIPTVKSHAVNSILIRACDLQVPPPPPPLTSHPMFAGQGPSAHPPSRPPLQGVTFTVGGLSAPKSEYSQAFPSTHSGESAAVPTSGSLQRPRFIAQHPAGNPFQSPPFM